MIRENRRRIKGLWLTAAGVFFVAVVFGCLASCRSRTVQPPVADPGAPPRTYVTTFPSAENPISENGRWLNGKQSGISWADVRSIPGLAFGTESGTVRFDDATALLAGKWGPDQTVEATVYSAYPTEEVSEEVEIRLRSWLVPHQAIGYEINFRCSKTENAYTEIVRWNGRLGRFTYLNRGTGARFGVASGDVVKGTIVRSVITAFINGVAVLQATDNTYKAGNPGIGFYLFGASGLNADYGFTKVIATDKVGLPGAP